MIEPQLDPLRGRVAEHVDQGPRPQAGLVGDGEAALADSGWLAACAYDYDLRRLFTFLAAEGMT
ncbi:hypothetical protein [Streptomyces camelliae]|uniref:hypothetical protein n=1 Tax=Streptomyces camelliae TaxID=3004093 RepID=UPI003D179CE6